MENKYRRNKIPYVTDRRQVMDKELAEMVEENGIVYHLSDMDVIIRM